jgi:PTH2 family peptidyl-tRNA hydrolase
LFLIFFQALYFTGNDCPDLALAWAIENPDLPDDDLPLDVRRHFSDRSSRPVPALRADDAPDGRDRDHRIPAGAEGRVDVACGGGGGDESCGSSYKMVFVVNSQLGMGVGKLAAQVGHAAVGLYRDLLVDGGAFGASVRMWEDNGCVNPLLCFKISNSVTKKAIKQNQRRQLTTI